MTIAQHQALAVVPFQPSAQALVKAEEIDNLMTVAVQYQKPTSNEAYEALVIELRVAKGHATALEEARKAAKQPYLDGGREVDAWFKRYDDKCEMVSKAIKPLLLKYDEEQAALQREAERVAAEAARKEQEKLRQEAAKIEQAARERREKDAARVRALEEQGRSEEAAAKRLAAEAADAARQAKVDELREAALMTPTAMSQHIEAPSKKGTSGRMKYSAECIDFEALLAAVATGKCPRELLMFNAEFANQMARMTKGKLNYPGIKIVAEAGMNVTGIKQTVSA